MPQCDKIALAILPKYTSCITMRVGIGIHRTNLAAQQFAIKIIFLAFSFSGEPLELIFGQNIQQYPALLCFFTCKKSKQFQQAALRFTLFHTFDTR